MGIFSDILRRLFERPTAEITAKTETSVIEAERFLSEKHTVSMVKLDIYASPSGGFVNWSVYQVEGKNAETGRKNKRKYEAKTAADAENMAAADGLLAPYQTTVLPHEQPTERQTAYLASWGANSPAGATKYDVSAILGRLEASNDVVREKKIGKSKIVEWIKPVDGPTEEFAKYADDMGVKFSLYIGKEALFCDTVYSLNGREKAAFFAYCILCAADGIEPGDLRDTPNVAEIYRFADIATEDDAVMRSINSRDADDYIHPHKGSTAYKAVAIHFGL